MHNSIINNIIGIIILKIPNIEMLVATVTNAWYLPISETNSDQSNKSFIYLFKEFLENSLVSSIASSNV